MIETYRSDARQQAFGDATLVDMYDSETRQEESGERLIEKILREETSNWSEYKTPWSEVTRVMKDKAEEDPDFIASLIGWSADLKKKDLKITPEDELRDIAADWVLRDLSDEPQGYEYLGGLQGRFERLMDRRDLQEKLKALGNKFDSLLPRKRVANLILITSMLIAGCSAKNTSTVEVPTTDTKPRSTEIFTPTSTLEPTSTSIPATPTIEFTATTAPTNTPEATSTPEATATPELIANLNTKLDASVNLEKLPVHQLEELTSGRLTYTEMQMGIKFPENTAKANLTISNLKDRFAIADFNPAANNYSDYYSPEKVPFKGISANMFEIDGQKVLVVGFLWMNSDNTTSVLHVGVQNWKDQTWMGYIKGAYQSTRRLGIISKIYNPSFNFSDWINFGNNQAIDQLYATDGGTRDQLIQEWVNTGNIPEELENLLLMPATARWR